jgi:hypothetical protein
VVGSAVAVLSGVSVGLPSPQELSDACDGWLGAGGPRALLGLGVAALAITALTLGLRSARRQARASREYLATTSLHDGEVIVDGARCRLIVQEEPQAFCAGYFRPRVYLSDGALAQLSGDELRAVVAHELHHVRRRDPLRLLVARSLADALFFIPILRPLSDRYRGLGELAADEAAIRAGHGGGPLASALLKFAEPKPYAEAVVGIDPERVDHLLGDPTAGRWRLPGPQAGRSALVLGTMGALLLLLWQGVLNPSLELPLLMAAACMLLMIGTPMLLIMSAFLLSRRALRARRV